MGETLSTGTALRPTRKTAFSEPREVLFQSYDDGIAKRLRSPKASRGDALLRVRNAKAAVFLSD
jgi:hypothetical protein